MKPGETGEEIPFLQLGVEKFGRDLFGNMIALGRLLCVCDVDFTDEHLTAALPKKYLEDNIAAIKYGYGLDQDSIKAIVSEQAASSFRRALCREGSGGHGTRRSHRAGCGARLMGRRMSPRHRGRGRGPRGGVARATAQLRAAPVPPVPRTRRRRR